jgi:hypothetical protein
MADLAEEVLRLLHEMRAEAQAHRHEVRAEFWALGQRLEKIEQHLVRKEKK